MALKDWGFIDKKLGDEPFPFLFGHGLIIKDGAKMSKSRGNIVNPDEYLDNYGADALRLYLMFIGPYDQGGDFRDTGMRGMVRFLNRIEKLSNNKTSSSELEVSRLQHQTVKRVTAAMLKLRYNVAIAALMEYVNGLEKAGADQESLKVLLLMLAPFAPFLTEELWQRLGGKFSIHQQAWPQFKAELAQEERLTFIVQVNGKLRGSLLPLPEEAQNRALMIKRAKMCAHAAKYLAGKKIVKEIFVPGRLVNLVVE
jgi:leucyl-tRNA synthetase